jgi:NDP-4-keto-2,6-dideoxyhexose 3-C-methyltransferase
MFYDLDDPNFFVEDVKKVLAEDGLWIVQQNYLLAMVEWGAVDNISHEHITYFSLDSFMQLMNRHGLEVHDVSVSSINGGSFRAFVSNKGVHPVHPRVQDQLEREKSLQSLRPFELFAARARRNLTELSQLINSLCEQGMSVYVLGASTRGSTIWQAANLDVRQIKKAVERNPEKVGLVMSALGIPIISEEQAREEHPDYMLVGPWFFRSSLIDREKLYLAKGGSLIFPLPRVDVVSYA